MTGKIKSITNPALNLSILSDEDIQKIHSATLDIIENTGVRFPAKTALDIWEAHGATVDRNTSIVKAPPQLIEDALKTAPAEYILGARDPSQDLPVDGNHVFLGTDGCGVEILDIHTGERRRSGIQDVRDIARIADTLEEIAFHWVALSAQDRPAETRGLHELLAVWESSTKHLQTESIYTIKEADAAVEMASAVAGSKAALRERPVLSIMQCTAPPLGHDGGSLEAALISAEAGLPVGFMTMASCLTTGPATMAGQIFITCPYPWVPSLRAQKNLTGKQGSTTAYPLLWLASSCRICFWAPDFCTAAVSGPMSKCLWTAKSFRSSTR